MDDETRRALTSALVDVASRRCQGRPAWRGAQAAVARPYPAVTCHVGVNGGRAPSPLCVTAPLALLDLPDAQTFELTAPGAMPIIRLPC
jgi:hypothetical protein